MKSILLLTLAFAVGSTAAVYAADSHNHDSHAQHGKTASKTPAKLELNNGKKWETDAALRNSMTKIKGLVDAKMPAMHDGKMDNASYDKLAKDVHGEIQAIFKNCKLSPKADAMLHLIMIDMVDGVKMMKGQPKGVDRHDGAMKVAMALADYGDFFDHPGWTSSTH